MRQNAKTTNQSRHTPFGRFRACGFLVGFGLWNAHELARREGEKGRTRGAEGRGEGGREARTVRYARTCLSAKNTQGMWHIEQCCSSGGRWWGVGDTASCNAGSARAGHTPGVSPVTTLAGTGLCSVQLLQTHWGGLPSRSTQHKTARRHKRQQVRHMSVTRIVERKQGEGRRPAPHVELEAWFSLYLHTAHSHMFPRGGGRRSQRPGGRS